MAGGGNCGERRRAAADLHRPDAVAVRESELVEGAVARDRQDAVAGDDRDDPARVVSPGDAEAVSADSKAVERSAARRDRERRAERVRPERTTTAYRGLELVVVDAAERVVQEIADAVLADLEDPLAGDWQGRERAFVDVACG